MDPEEGNRLVPTKVITNFNRRRQLRNYQRAVEKRNHQIDDQRVEIERLRSLMSELQLQEYDHRYADEDRDEIRQRNRNPFKMDAAEREHVKLWLKNGAAEEIDETFKVDA